MSRDVPIRDQLGTIIGVQPREVDPVQATLDASLKAVGATPTVEPTSDTTKLPQNPQRPSWRMLAIGVAVLSIAVLAMVFFSGQTQAPPQLATLPVTPAPAPTRTPEVTAVPANPREVILTPITLYGDYDEATRIGNAPDRTVCLFDGHSPDEAWAFLNCPVPVGYVWAKVAELKLSEEQQQALQAIQVVARVVPPTPQPIRLPANVFTPPPSLPFCADRFSQWGNTHQCSTDQLTAEHLAESEIAKINATAEAIHNATK